MKAAIVGAGIGGLTTGIALRNAGMDFEIFEASPVLQPVGAGISMASNAMQVFQRLGIGEKIKNAGEEIIEAFGVDESFKIISKVRVKEKVAPLYGIGSYAYQRGRLQQTLLSEIDPKKIHLNKKLATLQQSKPKIILSFEDNSTVEADVVIGADGIKSAVRKNIFGEIPFRYSGQTCWRGMTNFSLPNNMKNHSYEMWGDQKGLRFGFVQTWKDEIYYYTTFFTEANGKDTLGNVKKSLLQKYSRFGKIPIEIIESTAEENIIRSDIYDIKPIPHWWNGRVALLGDAAHATTPNLGQGGCQAVEDALVIAKCLKENSSVEKAFEEYQTIRYAKALHVINMSWRFGSMINWGNPISRSLRNSLMRMMPESMAIKQLDKIMKLN
jgi:2-polyprenyl-6-methoxyphenol hydroxylase-like FAD-dependent oxidoreductase